MFAVPAQQHSVTGPRTKLVHPPLPVPTFVELEHAEIPKFLIPRERQLLPGYEKVILAIQEVLRVLGKQFNKRLERRRFILFAYSLQLSVDSQVELSLLSPPCVHQNVFLSLL